MALRVVSAILFSPRGGSAHVARALARGLRAQGCDVTLLAGSRDDLGEQGRARAFYGEDGVEPVDFSPALRSRDPIRFDGPPGTAPLHPSYEDKPGVPDVVFAALDDAAYEHQVASWARELDRVGAADADVLHLHHLTPLNEAAARVAPNVPVVGQLHGTELLMLEAIDAGAGWPYAQRWAQRLRRWAAACDRLVVSEGAVDRVRSVLGVVAERVVPLPGGVDTDEFRPYSVDRDAVWREILGTPLQGPVLLFVGRFTAVKRIGLLIESFAAAAAQIECPSALVLVGGHPGEWEGEHPADTIARLGLDNVHLAGWHRHDELPRLFNAADAVVLTSSREQFGLVLVEAMACGIPAVATASAGPSSIISDGQTGWLVPAHDMGRLEAALAEVLADDRERTRRGRAAQLGARTRYSWSGVSGRLLAVLEAVARPTTPARARAQARRSR